MPPFRTLAARSFAGLILFFLLAGTGCAHHRESYYARSPGVHVRAPFVDVRVPTGPRGVRVESRRYVPEPGLDHEELATFDEDNED